MMKVQQPRHLKNSIGVLLLGALLASCQSTSAPKNQYVRRSDSAPLVDDKYSLKADREKMQAYRSDVPAEKQRENDEIALVLQLFQEVKKSPQDIREKFDTSVRKKRELFNRDMDRERENFTKQERKVRENFLKDQKDSRDAFLKSKPSKDEREEFFKTQDEKRKDYFSDEHEKRNDYESDVRERRKNFEDYIREKQNDFNQEYRSYSRRYDEWKKEKEKERENRPPSAAPGSSFVPVSPSNPEADLLEKELNDAKQRSATPLGSGE